MSQFSVRFFSMETAWAAKETVKMTVNTGVLDSIFSASLVVQLTLLGLVGMSVVSWAIIVTKRRQFRVFSGANEAFLNLFWKASSLDEVYEKVKSQPDSPTGNVFKSGFVELQRIADAAIIDEKNTTKAPKLVGIDNLHRSLRKASDIEIALMESRLSFLATVGSTGPFIGLFGTVWGIMNAFHKIGATGQASLAVVAPGISEALITTAIGLVTAIPAVVSYNHFVNLLKREELELSNFCADFLNIAKRNFFKDE